MTERNGPVGLKKFRVGYLAQWNFYGGMEVDAKDADDAGNKAQALLDSRVDGGGFADVTDFHVEFGDVNVRNVNEIVTVDDAGGYVLAGKNEDELRCARRIAALSDKELDGVAAARAVAEAVVNCRAHPVTFPGDGIVSFEYDNSFGPTCTVDDVLERMNMHDWRIACDEFCGLALTKGGLAPGDFDWPTPLPKVTKEPEDEGTDVISRVCVTFRVDEKTYAAILRSWGPPADDRGEETCCECDVQIRYRVENGKTVVTCPECGAVNPLCGECTRPEKDTSACDECELFRKCEELNKLRARPRGKEK